MQYYYGKNFIKSLKAAFVSGGPAQRGAKKIREIIGGIHTDDENPFKNFRTTDWGETRLKNCIKYKLDGNYRLVTQTSNEMTLLLFFGKHDEADKYLDRHQGQEFLYDKDMEELRPTYVSEIEQGRTVSLQADNADGLLWDYLEAELDELAEGLPAKQIRKLNNLEKGADSNDILSAVIGESDDFSEQMIALNDVLNCINGGDLNAAKNRFLLWKDSLLTSDEITTEEAEKIRDNDTLKRIIPGDPIFEQELDRYLNHDDPLEWFTFTHPNQETLITSNYAGPAQLSGVSGSGKTSVLIKRACRLLREDPGKQVLVVTLNQSLALLIENVLKALVSEEEFEHLQILPFYDLCRNLLRQFDPAADKSYRQISDNLEEHSDEVFREFYRCETYNYDARCMLDIHKTLLQRGFDAEAYIKEEFNWIRSFLTANDYDQYLTIDRKGRKLPLLESQRQQILEGIDGWIKKMRSVGVADTPMITHRVLEFERQIKPEFDYTLVDEVQDLGTLELKLIRAITKVGENDLFLVGDVAQSVLAKNLSLKSAGINYSERQLKLKLNYRNTKQILEAAYQVMYQNLDETLLDTEDFDFLDPEYANRSGEKPYIIPADTLQQEITNSITLANEIVNSSANPRNKKVGIILCGYTNLEVANFAEENGLTSLQNNLDFRKTNIFFSDLESSKGFEFDDVIIVNCNNTVVPPRGVPDEEAFRVGCQLYVAMTRAKTRLFISYSGECSDWIHSELDYFTKARWEEFIDENVDGLVAPPEKLPEVINATEGGDKAIFDLNGSLFVYTRFAIGVEKRILDWLERNVTGNSSFREGNKGVRNKWQNLEQLYSDLKRNKMIKTVPYFFSIEGDKELLSLFELIETTPQSRWKIRSSKPAKSLPTNRQIKPKQNKRLKEKQPPSKETQIDKIKLADLPINQNLNAFYKKKGILTVSQALQLNLQDYQSEPSLNSRAILGAANIRSIAAAYLKEKQISSQYAKEQKEREKQQKAEANHPRNTLTNSEREAIWLFENESSVFDERSINELTGVSVFRQRKLRKLASKYKSTEIRMQPNISQKTYETEALNTKKRKEAIRGMQRKLIESNSDSKTLPKYSAYEDK